MNYRSYFSFLKTLFWFLFFTIAGVVFGVIKVEEPDSIKNMTDKDFYVEYNQNRNLYFGMERVSAKNVEWWKKRLAYDAYFHAPPQIKTDVLNSKTTSSSKTGESDDLMQMIEGLFSKMSNNTAHLAYSPFLKEIETNSNFLLFLSKNITNRKKSETQKSREFGESLMGAIEGFYYNLENYNAGGEGATWVAYVSSIPVNGLLCSEIKATSPSIKMAMTVKVSSHIYSPLGIYRNPIAHAFDKETGAESKTKSLSMLLHSFVARMVGEHIMPSVIYMVFRPLDTMIKILESSKINYSVSDAKKQLKGPYLHCEILRGKPKNITLFDPTNDTIYKFGKNHWFCTSELISNINDAEFKFEISPFFIIDRRELGEYSQKKRLCYDNSFFSKTEDKKDPEIPENSCAYCLKKPEKLFMCSQCKKVHYCSKECQRNDWKKHKEKCK